MTLGELAHGHALGLAATMGISYRIGPFAVRLFTRVAPLIDLVAHFYAETELLTEPVLANFNVSVTRPLGPHRWWHPQAHFRLENVTPFEPYPLSHSFPLLEWGINWCIAMRGHRYLMLHSAVVERGGRVLILPALPGSGKSTLGAALAFRGWRLLSDEFGLIERNTGRVAPLPRPIPLKNRSIEVIRDYLPEAQIGPSFDKTRKGTVAHLRPSNDSMQRQLETAPPAWVVFPRYTPGSATHLTPLPKSLAFNKLAQNSFNYRLLGGDGFDALVRLIQTCDCYNLVYSDLDCVLGTLEQLAADNTTAAPT